MPYIAAECRRAAMLEGTWHFSSRVSISRTRTFAESAHAKFPGEPHHAACWRPSC